MAVLRRLLVGWCRMSAVGVQLLGREQPLARIIHQGGFALDLV
jgi:hypothetical protein